MASISKVHLVMNEANRFAGEAFVTFANVKDVETALEKVDGTKIRNTIVKVFRSSEEQFFEYCNVQMEAPRLQLGELK